MGKTLGILNKMSDSEIVVQVPRNEMSQKEVIFSE